MIGNRSIVPVSGNISISIVHFSQYSNLSGETESRAAQRSRSGEAAPSSAAERGATNEGGAGRSRFESFGQLEQDRQARTLGAERQQQWNAQREGGMGAREFSGRGGRGFRR